MSQIDLSPQIKPNLDEKNLMNPKKEFRYGVLFKLDKRDYIGWAKGLQKSGYATSKTYTNCCYFRTNNI